MDLGRNPLELPAVVPGLLAGNHLLVEAGGQHIHGFRRGLDYAFVRTRGRGACYLHPPNTGADPSARPGASRRRVYESLQGRPEVGPLPTPRRCHITPPRGDAGFADVSSVLSQASRPGATLLDRTPVRKS